MDANNFVSRSTNPVILVVEDEGLVRLDTSDALREAGFRVLEAESGDEAAELLRAGANVHLVCTDVRMPGKMNGIRLAEFVKHKWPNMPVIIVSGEVTARNVPDLADAKFTKPIDTKRFVEKVKLLLGESDYNRTMR